MKLNPKLAVRPNKQNFSLREAVKQIAESRSFGPTTATAKRGSRLARFDFPSDLK